MYNGRASEFLKKPDRPHLKVKHIYGIPLGSGPVHHHMSCFYLLGFLRQHVHKSPWSMATRSLVHFLFLFFFFEVRLRLSSLVLHFLPWRYLPWCITPDVFLMFFRPCNLSITLVNDQLDAQFFYFIIRLLQSSTCFEQRRAHHQEVKLY